MKGEYCFDCSSEGGEREYYFVTIIMLLLVFAILPIERCMHLAGCYRYFNISEPVQKVSLDQPLRAKLGWPPRFVCGVAFGEGVMFLVLSLSPAQFPHINRTLLKFPD